MPNKGKVAIRSKNKKNSRGGNSTITNSEITADDLALIGAGLTVLGDLFAFLSLVKVRQENEDEGTEKS
ncbi:MULTISPECIES: hypothetical protein [Paenibacillus]|uniref:hypothetical protein n=1 Tax=Paenibacillus TaxID=44249 RepID=UPI002FE22637